MRLPTITMTPFRLAGVLAGFALLAAAPAQTVVKDAIIKKSGERLRGVEILEMRVDAVKYRRGGSESELPALQLLQVEWTDPPDAMELGRAALARGDTQAAANFYQEAAAKAAEGGRKALEQECRFLAARCLALGMGNDATRAAAARDALKAFVEAAPKSFFAPEARLLLARSTRVAGDAAGAEALIKGIEEAAVQEGWGLAWDARAKFEKALALTEQGKGNDARIAYQSVASVVDAAIGSASGPDAADLNRLKMLALVGQGETWVKEGKAAEARTFFAKLAGTSGDDATRAAGLVGEAHALYLQGSAAADVKTMREAQIKLAEAILLDTASGDTSAKALYLQGKLLLALGAANESDNYKQRARDYFDSVAKHYARSIWADEARLELQK